VGDVIIQNEETDLVLSSAPEFSADGTWPPVATDWTPLRWELFEAAMSGELGRFAYEMVKRDNENTKLKRKVGFSDTLIANISRQDGFIGGNAQGTLSLMDLVYYNAPGIWPTPMTDLEVFSLKETWDDPSRRKVFPFDTTGHEELRRVVHSARWRRQDPVIQLPPGATHEVTHSVTTGLTAERSQTLSRALGLNVGGGAAGIQAQINSQLTQEFGLRLEITAQQEQVRKLTLSNQSANNSRRFALWHIDQQITITALEMPPTAFHWAAGQLSPRRGKDPLNRGLRSRWAPRGEVEFVASDEPFITFIEIDRS
jgi:hypothetical protein